MRQATKKAAQLFTSFTSGKAASNTQVIHKAVRKDGVYPKGDHWIVLELFGNEIAAADSRDGSIYITNAGWQSNTTKERLNGLPGVSISQQKGKWYLNGELWDGKWTKIA